MSIYIYVEGVAEVQALPRILADICASRRVRAPVPLSGAFLSKVVDALFNQFRHTRYKKGHDPERLFDGFTRAELDALCMRCPRFAAFVSDLRAAVSALESE